MSRPMTSNLMAERLKAVTMYPFELHSPISVCGPAGCRALTIDVVDGVAKNNSANRHR
jgi:hypothetical protein